MDGISFQLSHKELDELNILCQRLSFTHAYSLSLMRRHLFRIKRYQGRHKDDDDENDGFWSNGIYAGNPRSFIRPFCKKSTTFIVRSWGWGRQEGGGRPHKGGAAGARTPQVCCTIFLLVRSLWSIREGFKKKSGNFPTRWKAPPLKSGKKYFLFIWYMGSKKCFNVKKFFSLLFCGKWEKFKGPTPNFRGTYPQI